MNALHLAAGAIFGLLVGDAIFDAAEYIHDTTGRTNHDRHRPR